MASKIDLFADPKAKLLSDLRNPATARETLEQQGAEFNDHLDPTRFSEYAAAGKMRHGPEHQSTVDWGGIFGQADKEIASGSRNYHIGDAFKDAGLNVAQGSLGVTNPIMALLSNAPGPVGDFFQNQYELGKETNDWLQSAKSPLAQAQEAAVAGAMKNGDWKDVVKAELTNPSALSGQVFQSLPASSQIGAWAALRAPQLIAKGYDAATAYKLAAREAMRFEALQNASQTYEDSGSPLAAGISGLGSYGASRLTGGGADILAALRIAKGAPVGGALGGLKTGAKEAVSNALEEVGQGIADQAGKDVSNGELSSARTYQNAAAQNAILGGLMGGGQSGGATAFNAARAYLNGANPQAVGAPAQSVSPMDVLTAMQGGQGGQSGAVAVDTPARPASTVNLQTQPVGNPIANALSAVAQDKSSPTSIIQQAMSPDALASSASLSSPAATPSTLQELTGDELPASTLAGQPTVSVPQDTSGESSLAGVAPAAAQSLFAPQASAIAPGGETLATTSPLAASSVQAQNPDAVAALAASLANAAQPQTVNGAEQGGITTSQPREHVERQAPGTTTLYAPDTGARVSTSAAQPGQIATQGQQATQTGNVSGATATNATGNSGAVRRGPISRLFAGIKERRAQAQHRAEIHAAVKNYVRNALTRMNEQTAANGGKPLSAAQLNDQIEQVTTQQMNMLEMDPQAFETMTPQQAVEQAVKYVFQPPKGQQTQSAPQASKPAAPAPKAAQQTASQPGAHTAPQEPRQTASRPAEQGATKTQQYAPQEQEERADEGEALQQRRVKRAAPKQETTAEAPASKAGKTVPVAEGEKVARETDDQRKARLKRESEERERKHRQADEDFINSHVKADARDEVRNAVRAYRDKFSSINEWRWTPLSDIEVGAKKGNKPRSIKLSFDQPSYGFNRDAEGKKLVRGTKEYREKVESLAEAALEEIRKVYDDALHGKDDEKEKAKSILAQTGWYTNTHALVVRAFGSVGDLFMKLLAATSPNNQVHSNFRMGMNALKQLMRGAYDEYIPIWQKHYRDLFDADKNLSDFVDKKRREIILSDEIKGTGWHKKFMTALQASLGRVPTSKEMVDAALNDAAYMKNINRLVKSTADYKELRGKLDAVNKESLPVPLSPSGAKYGMNTNGVIQAIAGVWGRVTNADPTKGRARTAPKVITFESNLSQRRFLATIDVWMARFFTRLAYNELKNSKANTVGRERIPPSAEGSVDGDLLESGESTGEFGFGQDVTSKINELIKKDSTLGKTDLGKMTDADIQALVWFMEKAIWEEKGWTNKAGAGGSYAQELQNTNAERWQTGLSIQQDENVFPASEDQKTVEVRLRDTAFSVPGVISATFNTTEGRYGGVEHSINGEVTAVHGADVSGIFLETVKVAKENNQDSTFFARVLTDQEVPDLTRDRPGIEIYFKDSRPISSGGPLLKELSDKGVKFYTVITEGRPTKETLAGESGRMIGVRLQFIPEFTERYGGTPADDIRDIEPDLADRLGTRRWTELTTDEIAEVVEAKADEYDRIARDCRQIPGVKDSNKVWYATRVVFNSQYDGVISNGKEEQDAGRTSGGQLSAVSQEGRGSEQRNDVAHQEGSGVPQAVGGKERGLGARGEGEGDTGRQVHHRNDETNAVSAVDLYNGQSISDGVKAARAHADSKAGKGYAERTGAAREDEELHSRKQPALSDDDGYRGSYNPSTHTVTLTRDADVTTVVHEMSHAYLERLMEMYAAGKLPRLLAADAKAILDHFGITADDWAGMSTAQKRKIHEWFAYNSEIYLGQGKAPTLRLTRLFHRFATWVQQVYKDGGNVQKVLGIMFKDEFGEPLEVLPKAARQTLAHMYGDSVLTGRKSWGTNAVTEKRTELAGEFRQGWMNDRFADAKKRIARIVQRVRDGLSTNAHGRDSFEDYLPVSEETAERIGRLGFDVHGYVHSLTDASVAHALGRHGNQMEERENQIPLTDSDFLRLPEVVNRPDEIEYAGRSGNSGNNVLRFKKTFPDGTNIFVEEIRNGRKKLMLLTAYKKVPTALDARPPKRNPPLKRPKRSASDLPEDTIAEFPDGELEDSGDEFHSRKPPKALKSSETEPKGGAAKRRSVRALASGVNGGDIRAAAERLRNASPSTLQSIATALRHQIGRDEMGRLEFSLGRKAMTALGHGVTTAADALIVNVIGIAKGPIAKAYSLKAAPRDVRIAIRKARATEWKAFQTAEKLAKSMSDWDSPKREMLSDIIEKELQTGVVPPEDAVAVATKMRAIMEQQAQDLMDLGMLSKEAHERWQDVYLPRFYKRQPDLLSYFRPKRTMQGIGGQHLKIRGDLETVPATELVHKRGLGYELRDSRYRIDSEGGLVSRDGTEVPDDATVMVWRDWTREEREKMGEIRDGLYRFVAGYAQIQHDIALGRLFAQIAESEYASKTPKDGYSLVPDEAIPETGGVKRYGKLAGMYVRDDVFATIFPLGQVMPEAMRVYKKAMALWKEGKTAMNPVSHMNNAVGNLMFAHLAGLPLYRIDEWRDTVKMLRGTGGEELAQELKEAQDEGLFTGSFSQSELNKWLPPELQAIEKSTASGGDRVVQTLFNALTLGLRKPLGEAYQFEDTFFKAAIYHAARTHGMNATDAVDYALRFIPTYDDLPGGARALKDSIFPFFSWTYKAIPVLVTQAAAHPFRAAAVFGMAHAVNLAMYAMAAAAGDDDDWWERIKKGQEIYGLEQKLLPEYMQGYGLFGNPKFVRLWTDPGTGLPQFWNVSNMIPGGQFWDTENQSGGMPWPEMMTIGNPLWTMALGLGQNRDSFTGRDVVEEYDTTPDKVYKWISFAWRQLAPAIAPYNYHWDRLADAVAHTTGKPLDTGLHEYTGIGRAGQAQTMPSALMNTMGLKIRDVDFTRETKGKINRLNYQNREIKSDIKRLQRQASVGAITHDEALKQIREKQNKIRSNREKAAMLGDLYRLRKLDTTGSEGKDAAPDEEE